ncbi:hypothetical protein C0J52_15088 [Blattella germanica]|nr:hypothetical protein C0J52_15088 [Blattella germanica]
MYQVYISKNSKRIIKFQFSQQNTSSGGGRCLGVTPHYKKRVSNWRLFFSWKNHSNATRQAHGEVNCNDKAIQPHKAGCYDQ